MERRSKQQFHLGVMGIKPALLGSGGYWRGVVRRLTRRSSNRDPPWLMLRPSFDYDAKAEVGLMTHRLYRPEKGHEIVKLEAVGPDATAYAHILPPKYVGSSHGWLASYDWKRRNMFFSNPVRGEFRFLPIAGLTPWLEDDVHRVSFSSPPNDRDCRALMIYGRLQWLAVGLPATNSYWTTIMSRAHNETVAYSNKRGTFFCISRNEHGTHALTRVDLTNPRSPKVEILIDPLPRLNLPYYKEEGQCLNIMYMVFHEDYLYLVVRRALPRLISNPTNPKSPLHGSFIISNPNNPKSPLHGSFNIKNPNYSESRGSGVGYPHTTSDFDVYKIDIEGRTASHCRSSLDGLALFVGTNEPVAVKVTPEMTTSLLQPDSIYFTDLPEFIVGYYSRHDIGDNGVFNYQTKTFSTFLHDYPIDIRSCCLRTMLSGPLPLWYTPRD